LPESIGKLENLQSLSIKGNFSDVPQWIGNLSKLDSLFINSGRLKTIPTEIGNLKRLQTLVIKCSGISSLLSAIGNLISLRNLEIVCDEITELPAEIAQCPLVSLKLSCKKLNSLPATKDGSDFTSDIHVDRKMNWSDIPPVPDCFSEYYLCYTIHELFDHEHFALQDIAMVNQIAVYVEIECYDREMRF